MSVIISLSIVLSFFVIFRLPLGGSVTLAQTLPLIWFSLHRGCKYGVIASFIFGIEFEILNQWRIRFSTTSENNRAYRYIKSYAEKENETWVNPFQDIIDSFNFKNSQKRMESLFKLSSIETSIWHDLDGWEFLATFSVRPSTLPYDVASGSVKGSYWEKEFWIEFTLTDFPGGGLPRREYDLNKTITDLQESVTNSSFSFP